MNVGGWIELPGLPTQGRGDAARPLAGEQGHAAQLAGPQHRLAQLVLVDGVAARLEQARQHRASRS